jgi:RNA polymerase-binding transcription factor DksA
MSKDWTELVKAYREINEVSKKRLGAYVKKASADLEDKAEKRGYHQSKLDNTYVDAWGRKQSSALAVTKGKNKRRKGIEKALDKLSSEDYGAGFDGTDELDDKYRKETPGQSPTLKRVKKIVAETIRKTKRIKRRKLYGTPRPGEDETLKRHINPQKATSTGEKRADRNLAKTLPKD